MNNFKYIGMFFVIGCRYLMTELVSTKIYSVNLMNIIFFYFFDEDGYNR